MVNTTKRCFAQSEKKRMPDGHTLTILHIHNSYGSTNCFRFEGIISAFPTSGKAPLCFCEQKYKKILYVDRKSSKSICRLCKLIPKLKYINRKECQIP